MLPLAFDFLSPSTMLILAVLAVLLYGERLPEVDATWGKQFIELKKSLQGIRDQFEEVTREVTTTMDRPSPRAELSRGARGGDGAEVRAPAERAGGGGRRGLRPPLAFFEPSAIITGTGGRGSVHRAGV